MKKFVEKHFRIFSFILLILISFFCFNSIYSLSSDGLTNKQIDSESFSFGVVLMIFFNCLDSVVAIILDKFKSNKD